MPAQGTVSCEPASQMRHRILQPQKEILMLIKRPLMPMRRWIEQTEKHATTRGPDGKRYLRSSKFPGEFNEKQIYRNYRRNRADYDCAHQYWTSEGCGAESRRRLSNG